MMHAFATGDLINPSIEIYPAHIWTRHSMTGHGIAAETLQSTKQDQMKCCFRPPTHLLVAYEKAERRDGETFVEGLPPSRLRNLAHKLTLVPAGHEYREWHQPRAATDLMHFYFDPSKLKIQLQLVAADMRFTPRLFFEDAALWLTIQKLKSLVESHASGDGFYFEALGVLLVCELIRLNWGAPSVQPQIRGGLAGWQQRVVASYIEEHIAERIPLITLSRVLGLSPYYLCRAFKQSFGMPPHRYQTKRRIEKAKLLLVKPDVSMTEVGLTVGFSSPTEFAKVFRKTTGSTPSAYHRPWRRLKSPIGDQETARL